jgi:hypothetical protein
MTDFSHVTRCIEISRDDIILATESRAAFRSFLEQASAVSRPQNGGPLVLLLFSRMATLACDWLDGDLRIELTAQGEYTVVDVQVSVGFGSAERIIPRTTMHVPFAEFGGALDRVPQMIWPLCVTRGSKRMLLRASSEVRHSTVPPSIEIDQHCQSGTIPLAPPMPLPADPTSVIVFGARQEPVGTEVVRARHTMPYGCTVRVGT